MYLENFMIVLGYATVFSIVLCIGCIIEWGITEYQRYRNITRENRKHFTAKKIDTLLDELDNDIRKFESRYDRIESDIKKFVELDKGETR